jgi:hypothetical protein
MTAVGSDFTIEQDWHAYREESAIWRCCSTSATLQSGVPAANISKG